MEFYEDYYTEHPEEARRITSPNGEVIFSDTGDPLLDKWEEEFAKGVIPDMEEGLSQDEKEKLRKERELSRRARQQAGQLFQEDTSKKDMDPRFQSKFGTPGSKEERALVRHSRVDPKQLLGSGDVMSDEEWVDMLGRDG